jgi:membrane-associated phospholipid phosphatase
MDERILLAIHAHSTPARDALFRFSDSIGTLSFFTGLVIAVIVWHLYRGQRREAWAWLIVGLTTLVLQEGLKQLVARSRPDLWPRLVVVADYSFPSGHALASATFYPLLAWDVSRTWSLRWRTAALAAGVVVAAFVGFGRLYLGVHWPTDVVAGWVLGAAQTVMAVRWLRSASDNMKVRST